VCIDFDFAQAFQCVVAIDLLDGDVVILWGDKALVKRPTTNLVASCEQEIVEWGEAVTKCASSE
jgi:hypothetical protein